MLALTGFVLDFSGFVPNQQQTLTTQVWIVACTACSPLICYAIIGAALFSRFKLNDAAYAEIRQQLDAGGCSIAVGVRRDRNRVSTLAPAYATIAASAADRPKPIALRSCARSSPLRIHTKRGSQAVRLPQELRFDTDRVAIRLEGANITLSPPYKDWADYFRTSAHGPGELRGSDGGAARDLFPFEEREPFD